MSKRFFSNLGEIIFFFTIGLVLYKSGWQDNLFDTATGIYLLFAGFCFKMLGKLADDLVVKRKMAKTESERQKYIKSLYGR